MDTQQELWKYYFWESELWKGMRLCIKQIYVKTSHKNSTSIIWYSRLGKQILFIFQRKEQILIRAITLCKATVKALEYKAYIAGVWVPMLILFLWASSILFFWKGNMCIYQMYILGYSLDAFREKHL